MNHARAADRIDGLIRFFLYVLIFWLPYSPAVIESCVIVSLLLWISKRAILYFGRKKPAGTFRKELVGVLKAFRPGPTVLDAPIGLFLLACLLSVTASVFFAQSLHNFLTKTLEWFIIYYLVVEVFKDKRHIHIALGIFVFTAFATAIDGLIQFYITNRDIFLGRVIEPASRATAGFKTSNALGGYLAAVIPAVSAWILLGRQRLSLRLITFTALIFMVWSLGIAFSRGAYIGTFLGCMFLLFFVSLPKKRRYIYGALGLLMMTVILALVFILVLASSSGRELFSRYQSIPWRLDLWVDVIRMILDKPLFGHGVNTFMPVFQIYRGNLLMAPTYAHNCYIQLAAEIGLIGLLGFIWVTARLFHQTLVKMMSAFESNRNLAVLAAGLLSGVFAFLAHSCFDTNFYSLQLSVYLWYLVGMTVTVCKVIEAASPRDAGISKDQPISLQTVLMSNYRTPFAMSLVVLVLAALWYAEKTRRVPQYGYVFYKMGLECGGCCSLDKELAYFQKSVYYNPNLIEAHLQLAHVYERAGQHEQAVNAYKRVTELDYRKGLAFYHVGLDYFKKGDYVPALRYLLRADKQSGCPDDVIYFIARIYDQKKEYSLALHYYKGIASRSDEYADIVCPRIVEIFGLISETLDLQNYITEIRRQNLNYFADALERYFKAAYGGNFLDK